MKPSTLNSKRILAIDDDRDLLDVLEEEILAAHPDLKVEKAVTFPQAIEKMIWVNYDAVILDITSGYGFKLVQLAQSRHLHVGLLTTYPVLPGHPRLPAQMAARAFLSKERLGDVVPFLEKIIHGKTKDVFLLKRWLRKFVGILRRKHLKPRTGTEVREENPFWNKYVSARPF